MALCFPLHRLFCFCLRFSFGSETAETALSIACPPFDLVGLVMCRQPDRELSQRSNLSFQILRVDTVGGEFASVSAHVKGNLFERNDHGVKEAQSKKKYTHGKKGKCNDARTKNGSQSDILNSHCDQSRCELQMYFFRKERDFGAKGEQLHSTSRRWNAVLLSGCRCCVGLIY